MDELTEKIAKWLWNKFCNHGLTFGEANDKPLYAKSVQYYRDCARELLSLLPFEEIRGISIDMIDYIDEAEVHHQCKDLIIGNNRRILSLLPQIEQKLKDNIQKLVDSQLESRYEMTEELLRRFLCGEQLILIEKRENLTVSWWFEMREDESARESDEEGGE